MKRFKFVAVMMIVCLVSLFGGRTTAMAGGLVLEATAFYNVEIPVPPLTDGVLDAGLYGDSTNPNRQILVWDLKADTYYNGASVLLNEYHAEESYGAGISGSYTYDLISSLTGNPIGQFVTDFGSYSDLTNLTVPNTSGDVAQLIAAVGDLPSLYNFNGTVVAEPSTLVLALSGLVVIGAAFKLRRV